MSDLNDIKRVIMQLVMSNKAEEAWEYVESIRHQLTRSEGEELELWLAQNSYESFRDENAENPRGKWLRVAEHMKEGERLRDAFDRLPADLQQFVRSEADKSKSAHLH